MRPSDELVFAPLGGAGEIGMNLAIYGFGDDRRREWIAVDFGVAFADDALPGIDLIMPDIRYLVEERRNLLGLDASSNLACLSLACKGSSLYSGITVKF